MNEFLEANCSVSFYHQALLGTGLPSQWTCSVVPTGARFGPSHIISLALLMYAGFVTMFSVVEKLVVNYQLIIALKFRKLRGSRLNSNARPFACEAATMARTEENCSVPFVNTL